MRVYANKQTGRRLQWRQHLDKQKDCIGNAREGATDVREDGRQVSAAQSQIGQERPREDLFEAPDRHPKEQQREQERRSFATQNWWRFNKRNFEGRTVLVRAVGARAISGSFCSGKTLPEICGKDRTVLESNQPALALEA